MAAAPDAGFFCQYAVATWKGPVCDADAIATGGYTIRTTMDPRRARPRRTPSTRTCRPPRTAWPNTFALVRPGHDGARGAGDGRQPQRRVDAARGDRTTDIVADPSNVFGAGSAFKIFTTAAALENGTVGYDTMLPNPASGCFTPPPPAHSTSCYPVANDGRATRTRSACRTRWPRRRTSPSSAWRPVPGCRR